ncbi:MAG: hypothetical protein ABFR65_02680 [Pseudomonadota bacterium]
METYSLIIKLNSTPHMEEKSSRDEASLFDAAFRVPGNTHLQLNMHAWCDKAVEYLDHAISRTQNDLRSHVQRVYLYIDKKDADTVYGALVDLFIILKESGRPLRERMLEASRTVLGEKRYRFLVQHLDSGIRATDAVPPSRTSLLSKGLSGTNQLVMKQNSREISQQDPLEVAHDHLEYGQIDEARKVLEMAILREPHRPELHQDLLEIYRSTNAREPFLAMRRRLNADNSPLADTWQKLALAFAEES